MTIQNRKKIIKENLSFQSAFTIIELLVATALFVVIVAIASGSFVSALRTQRAMVALMAANDNVSLAIEQMAREIRTGTEFCININNSCSDSKLVFTNYKGKQTIYQLGTKTISRVFLQKGVKIGILQKGNQQITADNVDVQNLKFIVSGNKTNDDQATRVTIVIKVAVPQKGFIGVRGAFTNLQTTISVRNLE